MTGGPNTCESFDKDAPNRLFFQRIFGILNYVWVLIYHIDAVNGVIGILMFLLLFLLWLIFNGRIAMDVVIVGVLLCVVLYFFCCKFLGFSIKKDITIAKELPLISIYAGNLIWEVIKASLATTKLVLGSKKPQPALIKFRTDLKTNTARVLLANSITLTPGTITVDLTDDEYVIHCLDKSFGEGIDECSFVKYLRKMEEVANK